MAQTLSARVERGAGRVAPERLPYPVDAALETLAGTHHLLLVGTKAPVAFFAYPGKPSALSPPDCEVRTLAGPAEDIVGALEAHAEPFGVRGTAAPPPGARAAVHHNPDFKLMAKCTELWALQVALSLIVFHDDFRDIKTAGTKASGACSGSSHPGHTSSLTNGGK